MGRSKHRKPKRPPARVELEIESLDFEGAGVAHLDGKVFFVEGALTGERVIAEITKDKVRYARAKAVSVIGRESSLRTQPKCPHFGVCGGCAMQHVNPSAQVAVKARVLEDQLLQIGRQRPEIVLPPLHGPYWGYRHRARLSARYVIKKEQMMVGFHEKASPFVVDMTECHILPAHVSALLPKLIEFIPTLSNFQRLPQLELAVGAEQTALVLRHMDPLEDEDLKKLEAFGKTHQIDWWLQPQGPDSIHRLGKSPEESGDLHYSIPSFGIQMHFKPTDFTQVNHQINDALVYKAVRLLDVKPTDRVLDLFCGLGNFSLPLAKQGASLKAFEGSQDLVDRAKANAMLNGLDHKTEFFFRNLFEVTADEWVSWGQFDKILIDPPRDGAMAVVKAIAQAPESHRPVRIVYVSCNPSTLARDTAILCQEGGYRLKKAGVVNMFPHTAHVESVAVFER